MEKEINHKESILRQLYILRYMVVRKRTHMLQKGHVPSKAFLRGSFRNLLDGIGAIRRNVERMDL